MALRESDGDKSSKDLRRLVGGLVSLFLMKGFLKHDIAPQFSQPKVLPPLRGLLVGATGEGEMW